MVAVGAILFLAACIGHTALCAYCLNCWYGYPLPRRFLFCVRQLHGLLVVAFPILLWRIFRFDLGAPIVRESQSVGQTLLSAYIVVCWTIAFGVLPAITLSRRWRRLASLVSNHTRTIDICTRLDYQPVGRGRPRPLA